MRVFRACLRFMLALRLLALTDTPPISAYAENAKLLDTIMPTTPEFKKLRRMLHALFPYRWAEGFLRRHLR